MKAALACVLVAMGCQMAFADFADEFPKLRENGKDPEIQAYLKKAEETEKGNPDYYALASNYWWMVAQRPVADTKPSEKGELSIRAKDTGEEVGSLRAGPEANPEIAAKTLAMLEEGAKRFPLRADILLGLAHVQSELGKYPESVKTLDVLLDNAKAKPGDLRWAKNGPLPGPPEKFFPESLHSYAGVLFNAEQDALCEKLCDRIIEIYPDHPYAYNLKAGLADAQGKPDEMLRLLEIAGNKAPDDPLILMNLADTYLKRGDKAKAEKALKRVLEVDTDDETKDHARAALKDLGVKPEKKR